MNNKDTIIEIPEGIANHVEFMEEIKKRMPKKSSLLKCRKAFRECIKQTNKVRKNEKTPP